MKKIIFTFIFLSTILYASGQYTPIPLYDAPAPGYKDVQIKEKVSTSESGSKMVTNVTEPELWHFSAENDSVRPAVIICPGGGYRYQAFEHEGTDVAEWLVSQGFHAFVLKYRLPDENLFTDAEFIPLIDARQAILKVREKAEELNVDAGKTGIMGFSAGGHLAASASTLFDKKIPYSISGPEVRPDFSILVYPVISMTDSLTHSGSKAALLGTNPNPELVELFTLEKQVTRANPPTLIVNASDDESVIPDNTILFSDELKKHQVPVEVVILPKGGHGFGFRESSPAFEWTARLEKWLEDNIKTGE